VVIFGGATGDTGKYIITGDTYALDLISSKWSKLEGELTNMKEVHRIIKDETGRIVLQTYFEIKA